MCAQAMDGREWFDAPQSLLSPALRRLAGRIPHGVPANLISTCRFFAIAYARSHLKTSSVAEALWIAMETGRRCARACN